MKLKNDGGSTKSYQIVEKMFVKQAYPGEFQSWFNGAVRD